MGHNTLLIRDTGAAAPRPENLIAAVLVERGGSLTLDVCGQQMPVPGLLTTHPALRRHLNQRVFVAIRPEHLHDASLGLPPDAARTASVLHGTVRGVRSDGLGRLLDVEVADATGWVRAPRLAARVDPRCTAEAGDAVMLAVDLRHLRVFAATGDPL
ncbi:TOBE domain-containing protein [Dactylosporangium sp. NBC_01737]|uniref:TOBE domain-containing protein n=1 Tax=Dactylosporangium sp. NBC_01737 TaxID=2975959 RepID=UPI002E10B8B8|nr:TOBE domain-containing protein [Dactylosporangium sp. NBC_01737]